MYQLFTINILIILMDIALLAFEFANLYIWETETKAVIYSIKLKLEFAVLSKLVKFVGGGRSDDVKRRQSTAFAMKEDDFSRNDNAVPDFVDITKVSTDVSNPAKAQPMARKTPRQLVSDEVLDLARFEHLEAVTALGDSRCMTGFEKEQAQDSV